MFSFREEMITRYSLQKELKAILLHALRTQFLFSNKNTYEEKLKYFKLVNFYLKLSFLNTVHLFKIFCDF